MRTGNVGENVVLVYLVVCFFVFLAGFVDSIAGGGGLISLPAYMIAGLPVHTAIAYERGRQKGRGCLCRSRFQEPVSLLNRLQKTVRYAADRHIRVNRSKIY